MLNEPLPAGYSELFYLIHTHVYISKGCQLLQNSTFQQLWGREDLKGATAHLQGARAQGWLILGEKKTSPSSERQQEGRETSREMEYIPLGCENGGVEMPSRAGQDTQSSWFLPQPGRTSALGTLGKAKCPGTRNVGAPATSWEGVKSWGWAASPEGPTGSSTFLLDCQPLEKGG